MNMNQIKKVMKNIKIEIKEDIKKKKNILKE